MISKIIFSSSIFLVAYYLPVIIVKGIRGHTITWLTFAPFALGVTGMVLFFCHIY